MKKNKPTRKIIIFFVIFSTSFTISQNKEDFLSLDRYLSWENIEAPQISPDGKKIIYSRKWVDSVNDTWENTLWIMDSDGSKNRFLVDGSSAKWSSDNKKIAFLSKGKLNKTQIFVRWMDNEGSTSQISRLNNSPSNISWSPDGKYIAFQMLVDSQDDLSWKIKMPSKPKNAKWTENPKIIESLNYKRDRIGFSPKGYRHLFIISAQGGVPKQITYGDWHHDSYMWLKDGKNIVFQSLRIKDAEYEWRESELYKINIKSKQIIQLTKRKGPDRGPIPSPNGKYIAYTGHDWTNDTYIEEKLYIMNIDGSNHKQIAEEMGRSPRNIIWSEDSKGIYFTAAIRGTNNLYYASLNGKKTTITRGSHMLTINDVSNSGLAVGTLSSPKIPKNLISLNLKNKSQIKTLFTSNESHLSEVKLGDIEEIWYNSKDDFNIQGWIVKPPNFDSKKKYPLILRIHGGPHSMYNFGFDFKNQDHAANGYVVLYTNPRGSSGYGSNFGNAIKNAYPDKDYDDLMAGVDEVISKGYIDEKNLFVYGGSGGGVLTAWIVGHTNRFSAAVSKAPVINWISFVGTTDGVYWYNNFKNLPWEDPSEHLTRSPLMYVDKVNTPTMLMTGERDLRTPMSQTEEFYQALKFRKVPTAMIRLKDGWHSRNSPPTNFIRVQLYLRNWFERYRVE